MAEKITCIVVEPEKRPAVVKIEHTLDALQTAVGGNIEAVYPFDDPVAIICNEDGYYSRLPLNRALYMDGELRDRGEMYDIIKGKFLIVGLTDESFGDLSPELARKYCARFELEEIYLNIGGELRQYKGKTKLVSEL